MHSTEVQLGRTIGVRFDHGEDFYTSLADVCHQHGIRQGYIPMFIAGMREARLVGACDKLENPDAPVWDATYLENIEAFGGGTLAYDAENDTVSPHIHVSVGLKPHSATAYTSHLLSATIQFLTEMYIVEVTTPAISRVRQPDLYDVPLLTFGSTDDASDGTP